MVMINIDLFFLQGYTAHLSGLDEKVMCNYKRCLIYCTEIYEHNVLDKKNAMRVSTLKDYIGRIYLKKGKYRQAAEEFQTSLDIMKSVMKDNEGQQELAYKLANLAGVKFLLGRLDSALKNIKDAISNF
jgi:tetratricopeptide (TPR) repeat protein